MDYFDVEVDEVSRSDVKVDRSDVKVATLLEYMYKTFSYLLLAELQR